MAKRYTLTRPQRAAAVLVAMGKSRATQLLKFFKSEELKVMIEAAHTLKTIPQPDLEELVKEFEGEFAVGAGLMDSADTLDRILSDALTDEEMSAITGIGSADTDNEPTQTVWEKLAKVDIDDLTDFLSGESPQLCAVVLSRLEVARSAAVLEKLEVEQRRATVVRLLNAKPVADEVIKAVEAQLTEAFGLAQSTNRSKEGESRLAEILGEMKKDVSDDIIETITGTVGKKAAEGVRSRLFRFEDIPGLEKESRTLLCDGLPTDVLTIALRNADEMVKESILSSISQRSRRMIEAELSNNMRVRASDIDQARKSIATLALKMAAEGRIEIRAAA